MPAHDFTPSPTFESHPGAYCIHCGRTRDDHQSVGPSVPEQSFGGGAAPAGMVARDSIESRARSLRARGRTYARHFVGNWFEVDARSDGMSGRVDYENDVTTALQSFHWSVTHPTCQSEHEAREAARIGLRRRGGE